MSALGHVLRWRRGSDEGGVIHGFEFNGARVMLVTVPVPGTRQRAYTVLFGDLAFATQIRSLAAAKAHAEALWGAHLTRIGLGLAKLSAVEVVKEAA